MLKLLNSPAREEERRIRSVRVIWKGIVWASILLAALIPVAVADPPYVVYAGTDTLDTESADIGVKLGESEEFPASFIGCGNGDTVVVRLDDVVGLPATPGFPATGTTRLHMTHLCMYTNDIPGHGTVYLSLQTERVPSDVAPFADGTGAPTLGVMEVRFRGSGHRGEFTSTLKVNYDLRDGNGGPIFTSGSTGPITSSGVPWERAGGSGNLDEFCHSGIRAPQSWFVENHCVRHSATDDGDFTPGKGTRFHGGDPEDLDGQLGSVGGTGQGVVGAPTLSEWGLLIMGSVLLALGIVRSRR